MSTTVLKMSMLDAGHEDVDTSPKNSNVEVSIPLLKISHYHGDVNTSSENIDASIGDVNASSEDINTNS